MNSNIKIVLFLSVVVWLSTGCDTKAIIDPNKAFSELVEDIAGNTNNIPITANELNSLEGVSGAIDGVNYTLALEAANNMNPSGYINPANPTASEVQAVIDAVNAGPDTDGDEIPDSIDLDDDNDGYTDVIEIEAGTDPKDPNSYPDNPSNAAVDASNAVLAQIGAEGDNPDTVNSVVTVAQLNQILPALTGVNVSNETAYQDYIDANPDAFSAPATQAEVQAMVDAVNAAVDASNAVLAQIGAEGDNPDTVNSVVTVAQLNQILPALTGVNVSNETAYQDYIDANPDAFSAPATQAEVQAMVDAVNAAVDASNAVLAQIGAEGDNPDTVNSVVTVAQLNQILPALTGVNVSNETAYQDYIDANPDAFSAPATQAEVQAMVDAVNAAVDASNAAVDASNAVLAQIGAEGDNPDTVNSVVTVAQLNQILPALTGVNVSNETAYQDYIDANPDAFSAPATQAEVQAMVDAVNTAVDASNAVLAQIGAEGDNPDTVNSVVTVAQLNQILPALTGVNVSNETAYQDYIDANPDAFSAPATQAEVQAMVDAVNAAVDASNAVLAQIGAEGDNPDTVNSVVTVAQLNQILPALTGVNVSNETAYQDYIDANPDAFSAPATQAEVQAMVDAVNTAVDASNAVLAQIGAEGDNPDTVNSVVTVAQLNQILPALTGVNVSNETAYQDYIDANPDAFSAPATQAEVQAMVDAVNAAVDASNAVLAQIGAEGDNPDTVNSVVTVAQLNQILPALTGVNVSNETAYQDYIDANPDAFSAPATQAEVQAMVDAVNAAVDASNAVLAQIGAEGDNPDTVNSVVTVAQLNQILPALTGVNVSNETAYQDYIDANPDAFSAPATQAEVQAMVDAVNAAVDASNAVLAQIGAEGDNPDTVNSVVTVAQLNQILPALTGVNVSNETAYQDYIDANPDAFSAPATQAEVQAMVDAVNTAVDASNAVLAQIGAEGDNPDTVNSVVTVAQLNQILPALTGVNVSNETAYQDYIDANPDAFSAPATQAEVQAMVDAVNAAVDASNAVLAQIGAEGDNPDTVNSVVTVAQLNQILPALTGVNVSNETAYQDYIDANPDAFSAPATQAEVQAMVDAVNAAVDASNAVLAQIGAEGDNPDTVNSVVTVAQLNQILPALTGVNVSNETAYQDYIDANPDAFSAPATQAEVQAMVDAVNAAVDASNAVLAQIGAEGDNPDTVNSVVTVAQLNQILPALTGVNVSNETAYQDYIDANPDAFSAPATQAEVQAMVDAVNQNAGNVNGDANGTSSITADKTSVVADNIDTAIVTVAVNDLNDNPITDAIVVLNQGVGSSTISAVTNNNDGTYSFTITSTTAETVTYTPTANGILINKTVDVAFTAGYMNAGTSTVAVNPASVVADGVAESIITVTLKDSYGNLIKDSTTVTLEHKDNASVSTISAVTNNNDGTYTFTVKSTVAATVIYVARENALAIIQEGTVTFTAGVLDTSKTQFTTSTGTVASDGIASATLTVTLKDVNGNPVIGKTVTMAQGTGSSNISAVTDNGDGTYTFTVTSIVAETVTYTGLVDGTVIVTTVDVIFTPSSVDATKSNVTIDKTIVTADGTDKAIITIALKDSNNNPVVGASVSLYQGTGTSSISATVDNNDGTYTIEINSTKAESIIYLASADGTVLSPTMNVTFVAGAVSVLNSSVVVDSSLIAADGTAKAIVTVTLKDTNNNLIAGKIVTLSQGIGSSTISNVIDNNDGTYTFEVTNTTAEVVTYTATVDGVVITDTENVKFIVGSPDASTSTVAVNTASVVADGVAKAIITITVNDANNNPINNAAVTLAQTGSSTIGAIVNNGDGTYTADVVNSTAETVTYTASASGVAIIQTVDVAFVTGGIDGDANGTSSITADKTSVVADNIDTAIVTVAVNDVNNNPITDAIVVLNQGVGSSTISAVTNNNDGTYSFTITSTTAETVTYTPTANGILINKTVDVAFTAGYMNAGTSTVAVNPASVVADGVAESIITVTLKDSYGNLIKDSTTVTLEHKDNASVSTISAVTNNNDGTYTFTVKSTVAATVIYVARENALAIIQEGTVTFTAGVLDTSKTQFTTSTGTVASDGIASATLTVTLKDVNGNPVIGKTVTMAQGTGSSNISAVTDNGDGTYTFTVTSIVAETVTYTGLVDGTVIVTTVDVIFTPSSVDATKSNVTIDKTIVTADGTDKAIITIALKDSNNNPVVGASVSLYQGTGTSSISATVDNNDGTYTIEINSTKAESIIYLASADGTVLSPTMNVTFVAGAVSVLNSSVVVDSSLIAADGTAKAIVTVTLKDTNNNLIAGKIVTLSQGIGSSTISNVIDNNDGTYTFEVTNTTAEVVTYTATVDGVVITDTENVKFIAGSPDASTSTVAVNTASVVADGVAKAIITITVNDANNNPINNAAVTLAQTGSSTIGAIVNNGDGTYTADVVNSTAETVTYTASASGVAIIQTVDVAFVTGGIDGDANGTSSITADKTSVVADNIDTAIVTVAVNDVNNNPITDAIVVLNQGVGSSTISAVTNNNDGTYSFTVMSTTAETVTYTPTANGILINKTVDVAFTAGSADVSTSTVAVNTASVVADGVAKAIITITVNDANNNPINNAVVTLAQTGSSTIGAIVNNGDGTYTADVVNSTAETVTYTAFVAGVAIIQTVDVAFTAGSADVSTSTVAVNTASVVADGVAKAIITITVNDANNNPINNAVVTLAQTGSSTIGAIVNNGDGTYTADVVNSTAETVTYTASVAGVAIIQTVDVAFTAGSADVSTSTVAVNTASVVADGVAKAIITITVNDANNNPINNAVVTLAQTGSSTIGAIVNNGDGTYTADVVNSTAETVTYTASVAGVAIIQTVDVAFTAGSADVSTSTVAVNTASVVADGVAKAIITITVNDANNNPINNAVVTLAQTGSSTIGAIVNNGDGTYTADVVNSTAETVTYTASVAGVAIIQTVDVAFTAGSADVSTSTVAVNTASVVADGVAKAIITITVNDANNNPINNAVVTLAQTGSSTIGAIVNNGDGTYTADVVNSTAETVTYTASVAGVAIIQTVDVAFTAGSADVSTSTVAVNTASVVADGVAKAIITITVNDANNNPINNAVVTLAQTGSSTIGAIVNNGDGTYTADVVNSTAETVTYTASVAGVAIIQTVDVAFTAGSADVSTSTVAVNTASVVADGVAKAIITITVNDANNNPINNAVVTLAQTGSSTIGAIVNNGDGTYTADVVNSTAETVTYTASVAGVAIIQTVDVAFTAGGVDGDANGTSSITADKTSVVADNIDTSIVTVAVNDVNNNPITDAIVVLNQGAGSSTISAVTNNNDGTYSFTITSTMVETVTYTPTANGILINKTVDVAFTPKPLPANITITDNNITKYIASIYDNTPYSPAIDVQGVIDMGATPTGILVKMPYTVVTSGVTLPAYSVSFVIQSSSTEDGEQNIVATFSYPEQVFLPVGNGTFDAYITIDDVNGNNDNIYNAKKLDLDVITGLIAATFPYAVNSTPDIGNLALKIIPGIPDKMFGLADINGNTETHKFLYLPVTNPITGRIWLNNNLGADYANVNSAVFDITQQAIASDDYHAYGSMFQWGRKPDGHEFINWTDGATGNGASGTTGTTSDNPADTLFITVADWRVNRDDTLWESDVSTNNPCPVGYRLPTAGANGVTLEWEEEANTWNAADTTNYNNTNSSHALASELKLPVVGYRYFPDGIIYYEGIIAYYWSSSPFDINQAYLMNFDGNIMYPYFYSYFRGDAFPVRCIEN